MKKFLSVLIAFCLVLSTSLVAFAQETNISDRVDAQIQGAADYIAQDAGGFGVANAVDFSRIEFAMADASDYEDAFVQDVKDNLNANGGKLMVDVYDYATDTTTKQETIETYAAVICALTYIGEDVEDFEGVDLTEIFLAMDPTSLSVNPYNYDVLLYAVMFCDGENEDFVKSIADTMIDNYYEMGNGMNYYGFSCDNTAKFAIAMQIAGYMVDGYDEYVEDALAVIESEYRVDGGYCYNKDYGTDANCDSTALALAARCMSVDLMEIDDDELEDLNSVYADLCAFESDEVGVFTYGDAKSVFATKDALIGLSEYSMIAFYMDYMMVENDGEVGETDDEEEPKFVGNNDDDETAQEEEEKKSPATSAGITELSLGIAFCTAALATVVMKKKIK